MGNPLSPVAPNKSKTAAQKHITTMIQNWNRGSAASRQTDQLNRSSKNTRTPGESQDCDWTREPSRSSGKRWINGAQGNDASWRSEKQPLPMEKAAQ